MARGDAEPLAVWSFFHQLPVLDSMRLPTWFLVPLTLVIGMMVGFGIDWLASLWRPWGAVAGALLIVAATVDCLLVGPPNLAEAVGGGAPPVLAAANFRQISHGFGDAKATLVPAMANLGVLDCYEYTDWTTNARGSDQPGYQGEQHLLGVGSLNLIGWTPNLLTYDVNASATTTIVVNQNYDRWWRVVAGRGTVVNQDGLIGIRVPAGSQQIAIAYRDSGALLGSLITLATIAAVVALWRHETRNARDAANRRSIAA
jgi:hypothetical protein